MTEFKKYSSIDNHYQEKMIMKFLSYFPNLKEEKFVILEKIDGSNLQLFFQPNQKMLVGKRSAFLGDGENFFDVWNTLSGYLTELNILEEYCNKLGKSVRVFGELYGAGVQKRVNYGPDKYFSLFDIFIGDELLTFTQMSQMLRELNLEHMLVPVLGYADNLDAALAFDHNFDSKILNVENNPAEGFVLKPLANNYHLPLGGRFIFKKKADQFKEKEDSGHGNKEPKNPLPDGTWAMCLKFRGYINENRVLGIFSKHGPIESPKQIGDYIKLVLADAKEDFYKDHPGLELSSDAEKAVFNVGKEIVPLIKRFL